MDRSSSPCALVVDDDAVILCDATAILEEAGFKVITAMHAEEALQHLSENGHQLTVLFTDVEMPGPIDGFGLARHTAHRWPEVAIIVASGRRSPGLGDLPEKATFIGKPFSAEVVHGHLHKVVPEGRKPGPLRQHPGALAPSA